MNKQVSEWLKISRRDLFGAEFNLNGPDDLLSFAGYLAQQAAEKAIKGFLVAHKMKLTKTHNIATLLEKVEEINPVLAKSISDADDLTDFAIKYRYPEVVEKELTRKDVEGAVALAKSVCAKVLETLGGGINQS